MKKPTLFKLKGKTSVCIDWANVYNWKSSLKWEIDAKKLFKYLKSYRQIKEIIFYFGTDVHPASKQQIKEARQIGFRVVTKPVKYLPVKDRGITVWKRKCDFDLEIGLDCFERLDKYFSFIFFSGDGDLATLYGRLIKRKKQTIVVFAQGHLGKEIRQLKKGVYLCVVKKIKSFIQKNIPQP
jgi:uncharacterized LabA/DUF88 family protein